jgi:hypothetical protein
VREPLSWPAPTLSVGAFYGKRDPAGGGDRSGLIPTDKFRAQPRHWPHPRGPLDIGPLDIGPLDIEAEEFPVIGACVHGNGG